MEAYAVIETGGKQYRVQAGDRLEVEKLEVEVGESVDIDKVLAVSDGKELKVGTPMLEGSKVTATVTDQIRGKKVINYKKKRRKGYERKVGHRQYLTVLKVESVG
jgi:large subunit ribosomal protein L21